jgi:hypothetical protein
MENHRHYNTGINGRKVYVCKKENPFYDKRHNSEKWYICGILAKEKDAKMWVNENKDNRSYTKRTIGIVENRY